jgi:hypothetical protein
MSADHLTGSLHDDAGTEPLADRQGPMSDVHAGETQRSTRVVAIVLLAAGLSIAYWIWPSDIDFRALGLITYGDVMRAVGAVVYAVSSLCIVAILWGDIRR